MTAAVSTGWIVGWAVGALVVVVAAALLLALVALGRRIARQAGEITAAIDGARANTEPLFEVKRTNLAVDRVTRDLRTLRTGERQ